MALSDWMARAIRERDARQRYAPPGYTPPKMIAMPPPINRSSGEGFLGKLSGGYSSFTQPGASPYTGGRYDNWFMPPGRMAQPGYRPLPGDFREGTQGQPMIPALQQDRYRQLAGYPYQQPNQETLRGLLAMILRRMF